MRRGLRITCVFVVVLALIGATPGARSVTKATSPEWASTLWSKATSGLAAADEYRDGTYIYTDYVFDDRGAGARTYPSAGAPYMRNGADIAEVRVRPAGDQVVFGVRLNTLLDGDTPIVALGLAHERMGKRTVAWPFGAGLRATGVGQVITFRGTQAVVTDLGSGKSSTFASHVRNDTPKGQRHLENTVSVKLPVSALKRAAMPSRLRLFAAAGVRDGDRWLAPSDNAPAPFDVAFVAGEEFGNWQSTKQGALITGGDITNAAGVVERSKLPNARPPMPKGAHIRIYRPSIEMKTGEGIEAQMNPVIGPIEDVKAAAGDRWNGLFLPIAVWVPKGYDGTKPMPLFMHLHGLSQTHQDMIPAWISGDIDVPAIAVTPLGRGTQSYYHGQGALDVFESLAEAKRRYKVDDDRVFIAGLSMGGQGTYTLGMQRPDLFAAALPIVGTGAGKDFFWPVPVDAVVGGDRDLVQLWRNGSFGRELLDNALNLPFRIYSAAIDPLVNVAFSEGDLARWDELGYDHQAALFLQRSHSMLPEYENALFHRVLDGCTGGDVPDGCEAALDPRGIVRDVNPARIVYKSVPFMSHPDLGLEFDGAYWVSDMKLRTHEDSLSSSRIDVTSYGLGHKLRGQSAQVNPELRTFEPTGDPYKFQARLWGGKPAPRGNRLEMVAENLAAATVDLRRAKIDTTKRVTIVGTGDGSSKLTFVGVRGTRFAVTRDGQRVGTIAASAGRLVLTARLDGKHTYALTPLN